MSGEQRVFLAFDLGATSWRAALGYEQDDQIRLEEIYRQSNAPVKKGEGLHWDIEKIFSGIKEVLRQTAERNIKLSAIGIDSWSVDYGLLAANGDLLEQPRCYRDNRNVGVAEQIAARIGADYLFGHTHLMAEDFTTLCQLTAAKQQTPELLDDADTLLFIPDLLRYWLCGEKATDFTLATTSQLYNLNDRKWDEQLLGQLLLPNHFLPKIYESNSILGYLSDRLQSQTGVGKVPIVTGSSHDTAAAFAAAQADQDSVILSSGTWSIIGVNMEQPLAKAEIDSTRYGYEGNPDGTVRLISNVVGMYLLEQCRLQWDQAGEQTDYHVLTDSARACTDYEGIIDPFWDGFANPQKMTEAILSYCRQNNQPQPENPGHYARAIFRGLAASYAEAITELRKLTGKKLETLVIVGGGSQNDLLNELTAEAAGVEIRRGYVEATAMGNIMSQQQALKK